MKRLAVLLVLACAWPALAQVERLRVSAGTQAQIFCAEPAEVAPERREVCNLMAEPGGDAVLLVPEPALPLGLMAGGAALVALAWWRYVRR